MKAFIMAIAQIFLVVHVFSGQNQGISSLLSINEVETHLRFLASDELIGREPGTYGARVAARYIAEQFRRNGLKPFPDCRDYFQNAEYTIANDGKTVSIRSRNVIGFIEGTDPVLRKEYVLLCAHYDHLGVKQDCDRGDNIFNGARDNGMGIVSLISAAKVLSLYPVSRSVVFAAFTGEEEGMRGSRYFIRHPPLKLSDVKFVLNNDGGGYNDTTVVRVAGLERTTGGERIIEACAVARLGCLPYPAELQYLYFLSDNAPFAEAGIPSVTMSPGFDKVDEEILKYVHTVADEADDHFDYAYLRKFAEAYSLAAMAIANSDIHATLR